MASITTYLTLKVVTPTPTSDAGAALVYNFQIIDNTLASLATLLAAKAPLASPTFTGTITGNGSGLSSLNAGNLSSGTVPTARLGSGTASSSTYLRGDQTWVTATAANTPSTLVLRDSSGKSAFGTITTPFVSSPTSSAVSISGDLGIGLNTDGEIILYGGSVNTLNVTLDDGGGNIYCQTISIGGGFPLTTDGTNCFFNGNQLGSTRIVYGDGNSITFCDGSYEQGLWTSYPPENPDPNTGFPAGGFCCFYSGIAYVPAATPGDETQPIFVIFPSSTPTNEVGLGVSLLNVYDTGQITTFNNTLDDSAGNISWSGTATGDGSGLTNLTAGNISGTISNSCLPSAISVTSFTGNGSALTNLSASNIASGTISNARLPATISVTNVSGNGSGLTNLSASALTTGAVPAGLLPATITGGASWTTSVMLAKQYAPASGCVALTDGATIATDASLSNVFTLTLGGNHTLSNPTNMKDGQQVKWIITQDATGSRTLSFGTAFSNTSNFTLSSTASSTSILKAVYVSAVTKWFVY